MARFILCVQSLAVCTAFVAAASGAEPPAKAKIEFRWLAEKPVKGVTDAEGIQTTCGPELLYPHTKPALVNADVASTVLKHLDLSKNGLSSELYTVEFNLSDDACKKLAKEAGDNPVMQLAIFVDGKYWGTGIYRKADAEKFTPSAGFIPSKAEAERIVAACK